MFLSGLQLYFILMNWTVELSYCSAPITEESDCFLCPETVEFCTAHNPLFLARPEWLRLATCFSAYAFCVGYLVILWAALTDGWAKLRAPILLFVAVHKSISRRSQRPRHRRTTPCTNALVDLHTGLSARSSMR